MAIENKPFEDVFPIENGDFSINMLVYRRVYQATGPLVPKIGNWGSYTPENKRLEPESITA